MSVILRSNLYMMIVIGLMFSGAVAHCSIGHILERKLTNGSQV